MKTNMVWLAIIGILLTQCTSKNTENLDESQSNNITEVKLSNEELANIELQTDTLQLRSISSVLHFKGKVDVPPQNIYSLSVPLGGYLKYTHLLPGTKIKKGEIIAVMEDPQYIQIQEDYLNTKNLLATAEKNYIRQKELWEQKATSDKIYEQALAEYESYKIKLNALKEKLQLINIQANELTPGKISKTINIYAPFTGYVTQINFSTGKYINPADVLFELVNPEDIHLNIKILEKDLAFIKIGQKVMAYLNNLPEKKHSCEIILINKKVNEDGTIDVHCHFDNYDEMLIPGTFMQADVMIENQSKYVIPSSAVLFFNNKYYVFEKVNANTFHLVEVRVGFQNKGFTAIENFEKLKGKEIVIKGAYALLMKLNNTGEE